MIIDAHVHLPIVDGCISLQQKKERLLLEMTQNQVRKCIVISDSDITSPIGTVDECVELFKSFKTKPVVLLGLSHIGEANRGAAHHNINIASQIYKAGIPVRVSNVY